MEFGCKSAIGEAGNAQVALSLLPKDRPKYHGLVNGADHTTYVA